MKIVSIGNIDIQYNT